MIETIPFAKVRIPVQEMGDWIIDDPYWSTLPARDVAETMKRLAGVCSPEEQVERNLRTLEAGGRAGKLLVEPYLGALELMPSIADAIIIPQQDTRMGANVVHGWNSPVGRAQIHLPLGRKAQACLNALRRKAPGQIEVMAERLGLKTDQFDDVKLHTFVALHEFRHIEQMKSSGKTLPEIHHQNELEEQMTKPFSDMSVNQLRSEERQGYLDALWPDLAAEFGVTTLEELIVRQENYHRYKPREIDADEFAATWMLGRS